MKMEKPCDKCKSVNARDCENKRCLDWQMWFVKWWNDMRKKYLKDGGNG